MVMIPLNPSPQWIDLSFRSIPKNTVAFKKDGLHIQVDKSASPLIYKLKDPLPVSHFKVVGQRHGDSLRFPAQARQGKKGYDDFVIRLGLVVKGERTLSWLEQKLAPAWVKTLFSLAPEGVGVKGLQFYSMGSQKEIEGSMLTLDKRNLVTDTVVGTIESNGQFVLEKTLPEPQEILALWISTDGDDTQARFDLEVSSIGLTTAMNAKSAAHSSPNPSFPKQKK